MAGPACTTGDCLEVPPAMYMSSLVSTLWLTMSCCGYPVPVHLRKMASAQTSGVCLNDPWRGYMSPRGRDQPYSVTGPGSTMTRHGLVSQPSCRATVCDKREGVNTLPCGVNALPCGAGIKHTVSRGGIDHAAPWARVRGRLVEQLFVRRERGGYYMQ